MFCVAFLLRSHAIAVWPTPCSLRPASTQGLPCSPAPSYDDGNAFGFRPLGPLVSLSMPAPEHPTDSSGFRVPQQFDDDAAEAPPSPYQRRLRWIVGVLLAMFVGTMLFRSQLADVGRQAMADYYLSRAQRHYHAARYDDALSEIDRALVWHDAVAEVYFFRARLKKELQDIDGAIADLGQALEKIAVSREAVRAQLYVERSFLYLRQKKHTEALADMDAAFELRAARDALMLNTRAYVRALCNVQLDEALKDIEQALKWSSDDNAAFIDTRGYVYYRLKRYDEALADIERAIELTSAERADLVSALNSASVSEAVRKRELKNFDNNVGVMIYHRGEIHEQLGHKEQAEADKRRGIELGYNPELGVF